MASMLSPDHSTSSGSLADPLSSNGQYASSSQLRDVVWTTRPATPPPTAILSSGMQRRLSLSFEDGNVAVLAGNTYFLVHRGFLSRHSESLAELTKDIYSCPTATLEGRPVLHLPESPDDITLLLHSMYDGLYVHTIHYIRVSASLQILRLSLMTHESNLRIASVLLRLSAKYAIEHLFNDTLAILCKAWPTSLTQWTRRERQLPRVNTEVDKAISLPHPM